jgi:predicted permease
MSTIIRLILPFFGIIFLGYGAGRLGRVTSDGLAGLNFFVSYIAMPALFFQLVAVAPPNEASGWAFVATTTFSTYCAFAVAFSVGALLNRGHMLEATMQGLAGSWSNVGGMAAGLVLSAFGTAAAVPMALIFSFDNALMVALVPLMMALGGTARIDRRVLAETVLRQALLHPLVLATIAGLIVAALHIRLPGAIDALLTMLRNAAAPGALFALGVGLAAQPLDRVPPEMPLIVAVKLIAHPLIVYLLLGWVGGFDALWVYTAVLLAALPPGAGVLAYARQYGVYADKAGAAMLLGTVISIATVTVVLILLVSNVLPIDPFR